MQVVGVQVDRVWFFGAMNIHYVSCQNGGKSNMVQITKTWHCRLFRYWDKSECLEAGATVKNSSKLAVFGTKNGISSEILVLTITWWMHHTDILFIYLQPCKLSVNHLKEGEKICSLCIYLPLYPRYYILIHIYCHPPKGSSTAIMLSMH